MGAPQRRAGWQGARAVTFRLPGRDPLQQAAKGGEWRVREEAGEESCDRQTRLHRPLPSSSKPPRAHQWCDQGFGIHILQGGAATSCDRTKRETDSSESMRVVHM